jgi:glutamyl-tRNA reductase
MLGVNHQTASVAVRERVSVEGERLRDLLRAIRGNFASSEIVVVSTCNRTEFYLARPSHAAPSRDELVAMLSTHFQIKSNELQAVLIQRENEQAVNHLFRVTTGLESMVLGEPQILGQVKRAYEAAAAEQVVGTVMHRLFQEAVAVGKHVRRETGIDQGRMSVGSVAVDYVRQIFADFDDKVIVGIGAGEMAKLTLTHLRELRPAKLWLTNRTTARAESLASHLNIGGASGGVRLYAAMDELLVEADILVTSTAAREPIITVKQLKPLLRKRRARALCMIDLAIPRDIADDVSTLSNVYVYNLDDLQKAVAATHEQRTEQVQHCEKLLFEAVRACMHDIQHRDIGQLIKALRNRLHEIGELEQDRTRRKLASARPEDTGELLEEHTRRLINKILHLPLRQLDSKQADAPLGFYAAALRRLFDLHTDDEQGESSRDAKADEPRDDAARTTAKPSPRVGSR